jgi:hypothetical protein
VRQAEGAFAELTLDHEDPADPTAPLKGSTCRPTAWLSE